MYRPLNSINNNLFKIYLLYNLMLKIIQKNYYTILTWIIFNVQCLKYFEALIFDSLFYIPKNLFIPVRGSLSNKGRKGWWICLNYWQRVAICQQYHTFYNNHIILYLIYNNIILYTIHVILQLRDGVSFAGKN